MRRSDFTVRRLWFSSIDASHSVGDEPAESLSATFIIDGTVQIEGDSGELDELDAGAVIVRARGNGLSISAAQPIALIQIETRSARIPLATSTARVLKPTVENSGPRSILASSVTGLLNSTLEPDSTSFPLVQSSVESALAAVIAESNADIHHPGTSSERALYRRASVLIEAQASDPTFTLDTLATELAVSKPYLQRVFRVADTTPLRSLQRIRAVRANELLQSIRPTVKAEVEEIAHRSGFPSARTMRDVIARELGRRSPTD